MEAASDNREDQCRLAIELRRIDWEEAMFAWRIVQPVIYHILHGKTQRFIGIEVDLPVHNTDATRQPKKKYRWYDIRQLLRSDRVPTGHWRKLMMYCRKATKTIKSVNPTDSIILDEEIAERTTFYPGTYLKRMETTLAVIAFAAVVGLCIATELFSGHVFYNGYRVVLGLTLLYAAIQWAYIIDRIPRLETGIVFIQTCAFVWRIVCLCHIIARQKAISVLRTKNKTSGCYQDYTCQLAAMATKEVAMRLDDIHDWIRETEDKIIDNLNGQ